MSEEKKMPARVITLAEQVGDTPLDWKEYKDGTIVIVFNSKGKLTFQPETTGPKAEGQKPKTAKYRKGD